jgi:two-component system OmpR family sensor kinase
VRTLTTRVVALVVVVAVASALLIGLALARAAGSTNREQAVATLRSQARLMAAVQAARANRLSEGEAAPAVRAMQRALNLDLGVVSGVVGPTQSAASLPAPFTAEDLTVLRAGRVLQAQRINGGRRWIVVGRMARADAILLAQPMERVVGLTGPQRRQLLVGLTLGLVGGALAGLALGRTVTRPLARVAEVARRLSAGQRDVRVPAGGPLEVADVAQALNGLAHALTVSEQRQKAFLMNVSHELRTPLTAVTGYAEALSDGALAGDDVAGAAVVIRDEANRLRRRVDDLLALARMEADDFRLELAPVDAGQLLRAAAAAGAPRAAAAGIRLSVDAPAAGPVTWADGERLRQAVDALVDNALRVLPAGAPLVLAASADERGWVRVEVRDGGPGLATEDLAVAFERGALHERYRGSRAVGSGLGLALVGELARRMGGHPEASPAPEGGACFAVHLPPGRREPDGSPAGRSRPPEPGDGGAVRFRPG